MAKGAKCPHCGELTFHDEGGVSVCSSCKAVGWSWQRAVEGTGKGKGNECPNCGRQTLHKVGEAQSPKGTYVHAIRRCSTCDYSLIEPVDSD